MGMFSKIVGGISGLGDIVEAGAAIKTGIDLFTGDDDVPGEVRRAGQDVSRIARALADPDDPMFQRLAGQEEGIITRDYARALRELGTANLRATARTGQGILNPERRDEALAGAFAKSLADRKRAARQQAREYLSGALQANQAVAGAFAPQIAADQRERERRASGMQFLLDLTQQRQQPGINFDVSVLNPSGLSFAPPTTSRPAVSTYTTPGLSFTR